MKKEADCGHNELELAVVLVSVVLDGPLVSFKLLLTRLTRYLGGSRDHHTKKCNGSKTQTQRFREASVSNLVTAAHGEQIPQ